MRAPFCARRGADGASGFSEPPLPGRSVTLRPACGGSDLGVRGPPRTLPVTPLVQDLSHPRSTVHARMHAPMARMARTHARMMPGAVLKRRRRRSPRRPWHAWPPWQGSPGAHAFPGCHMRSCRVLCCNQSTRPARCRSAAAEDQRRLSRPVRALRPPHARDRPRSASRAGRPTDRGFSVLTHGARGAGTAKPAAIHRQAAEWRQLRHRRHRPLALGGGVGARALRDRHYLPF
jgi:hypothetical protein